jgi:hypothetical protein
VLYGYAHRDGIAALGIAGQLYPCRHV